MTLSGGVNIYGPFDAGFVLGQACNNNKGQCDAGSDVASCEAQLAYQCGADFRQSMMPDACGGHATPYHFHTRLACEYRPADGAAHSPLVGVMLDGVGLYGAWEGAGQAPVLDACNGHLGPVPADATYGVPAGGAAYHYHVTAAPPFTVGCFGPVDSLAACKALYSQCGAAGTVATMSDRNGTSSSYRLFCPCFQHRGTCNAADFPALCGARSLAGPAATAAAAGTPTPAPGTPSLSRARLGQRLPAPCRLPGSGPAPCRHPGPAGADVRQCPAVDLVSLPRPQVDLRGRGRSFRVALSESPYPSRPVRVALSES